LPLYAVSSPGALSALVFASVGGGAASYAGIWRSAEDFPGRALRLPEGRSFREQIETWRESMTRLLGEYASGDTRVFVHDLEPAEGNFAPLTRVYEQLALHEGWLEPWTEQ
ncbi:MAG TPA: hypothetical protein VFV10_03980, partial [Gammaproteobacteria bacterium]|nr:hypothetical protein [Gammaproteobacteria bacterium]